MLEISALLCCPEPAFAYFALFFVVSSVCFFFYLFAVETSDAAIAIAVFVPHTCFPSATLPIEQNFSILE